MCDTIVSGSKSSESHNCLMRGIPKMVLTDMSLPKEKYRRIGFDVMVSMNGVLYLIMAERTPCE